MQPESEHSVSQWIVGAKRGDSEAVRALWQRYFGRLVDLAQRKLAGTPRRAADEEDVALSAFASFCRAAEAGRVPDLSDRDHLWRLLITLTAHKAIDQTRREGRGRRGSGRVRGESALAHDETSSAGRLAQVIGDEPTPEFAASVAEQCERLLNMLDDVLRGVALAKMEHYSNQEIAEKLDCSMSTVERRLRLIRKIWQHEMQG